MNQRILTAIQPYLEAASAIVAGWLASTHLGLHYGSDQVAKALTFIATAGLVVVGHVSHKLIARLPAPLVSGLRGLLPFLSLHPPAPDAPVPAKAPTPTDFPPGPDLTARLNVPPSGQITAS